MRHQDDYIHDEGIKVILNFELGIKVGGVLESSGSQLFKNVPTFDF